MPEEPRPAPEWRTTRWFNTDEPLTVARLRGRVVLLHAFQMLCPGCASHGLPQAQRVARLFAGAPLVVVGLHTVFEHHEVMAPEALKVFLLGAELVERLHSLAELRHGAPRARSHRRERF